MSEVPLMIKLGALKEPIFPRKLARERRYAGHDWASAGGASAREVGMVGVFVLLDIFLGQREDNEMLFGIDCLIWSTDVNTISAIPGFHGLIAETVAGNARVISHGPRCARIRSIFEQ